MTVADDQAQFLTETYRRDTTILTYCQRSCTFPVQERFSLYILFVSILKETCTCHDAVYCVKIAGQVLPGFVNIT